MAEQLTLNAAVGEWVAKQPATSRVFERHHIDYCCGGGRTVHEACASGDVDAQMLLAELQAARQATDEADPDDGFTSKSLAAMCDAIEQTHHAYLRDELPRLAKLVAKVVDVHGKQHAWLPRLAESFQRLCEELTPHMSKEEQFLFPAIRVMDHGRSAPSFPFGSIDNPIRMMEHEHAQAGEALHDIRAVTSDFTPPHGACNTFRALLDGLRELESDLHRHIHKENNVLFPRASRRAQQLMTGRA